MSDSVTSDNPPPMTEGSSAGLEPEMPCHAGEDTPRNSVALSCADNATELCDNCLDYRFTNIIDPPEPGGGNRRVFTTLSHLVQSAPFCPMCKLISDAFERRFGLQPSKSVPVGHDPLIYFTAVTLEERTMVFTMKNKPGSLDDAPPLLRPWFLRVYTREKGT